MCPGSQPSQPHIRYAGLRPAGFSSARTVSYIGETLAFQVLAAVCGDAVTDAADNAEGDSAPKGPQDVYRSIGSKEAGFLLQDRVEVSALRAMGEGKEEFGVSIYLGIA